MIGPQTWLNYKSQNKKISMLTCYDYSFAQVINSTDIDAVLVGDSSEMVIFGAKDTIGSSVEKLSWLTQAVRLGAPDKFIVCDIPFGLMQMGQSEFFKSIKTLMQSGANAIKVEGVWTYEDRISQLMAMGVPIMGHLGLTPQHINHFGGFKVQGKSEDSKKIIFESAKKLQDLGAFALVLECVPQDLALAITNELSIPTIGIGAGVNTDGQILVLQDLLGMNPKFKPKFVRQYLNGFEEIKNAVDKYVIDVQSQSFPSKKEAYES